MGAQPLALLGTGMVTSIGVSAPTACAAIRAGLTNPTETRFRDGGGDWIMSHSVGLEKPWRGREKLARMAAMAVEECIAELPQQDIGKIPLLLCVAERNRPGRMQGLDDELLQEIQELSGVRFAAQSGVIPQGRVGISVALLHARKLVYENGVPAVLIVGTDSLLTWPTLEVLEKQDRLLTNRNSNGFIPGEAAAGVLVRKPLDGESRLQIEGLGFAAEAAHIDSAEPSRAEGLTQAIRAALSEAACQLHDLDFRITDISGEQFYFREAALAMTRVLRQRKETFDLWHPAECIGEVGSAIGPALLAVADAASRKGYADGPGMLLHVSNDAGQRAAIVVRGGSG